MKRINLAGMVLCGASLMGCGPEVDSVEVIGNVAQVYCDQGVTLENDSGEVILEGDNLVFKLSNVELTDLDENKTKIYERITVKQNLGGSNCNAVKEMPAGALVRSLGVYYTLVDSRNFVYSDELSKAAGLEWERIWPLE